MRVYYCMYVLLCTRICMLNNIHSVTSQYIILIDVEHLLTVHGVGRI